MERPERRPTRLLPSTTKNNLVSRNASSTTSRTLHRIQRHPLAYRQVEGDIRKCRVTHFPYGVIYRVRSDLIEIIAVMHLRRSPGYWKQRT